MTFPRLTIAPSLYPLLPSFLLVTYFCPSGLATTEPNKLLDTIISRCIHLRFKGVRTEDLCDRLAKIGALENLTVTREAVTLLAQTSDGSLREAVQLLDQLAGDDISIDGIRDALILPKGELMQKLVDVILTANYAEYLDLIKTLLLGSTPEIILNQLTLAFRDLYLLSLDPKTNGLRIGMDGLREHGVDPETAEILLSILRQKSSLAMPNPEVWLEITILDLARVMGF